MNLQMNLQIKNSLINVFFFLCAALLLNPRAFGKSKIIKECHVSTENFETKNPVQLNFQIINSGDSIYAIVNHQEAGLNYGFSDSVFITTEQLRPNFNSQISFDSLNAAEKLMVHTLSHTTESTVNDFYFTGIDLSKVRGVNMYLIGKSNNMGSTTIVEAMDAEGKLLGSFLGGFLIRPCK